MKTGIIRIVIVMLVVSLAIICQSSEGRTADTLQRQPTLRTLQPAQKAPMTTRTMAVQPVQTAVRSAVPNRAVLFATGGSVTVNLSGSNLNLISSVQILLNGRSVPDVTARLGSPSAASRQLTLTARSGAPPGSYQVRLIAGSQTITLSASVLTAVVQAPATRAPVARVATTSTSTASGTQTMATSRIQPSPTVPGPSPVPMTLPDSLAAGVVAKPSGGGLNNTVRGNRVSSRQQAAGMSGKLGQPPLSAPSAPSSPGLRSSIQRTMSPRPSSADSGADSDSSSGSGLKSASGAESFSADQQADATGTASEGTDKMPPEVPLEKEKIDPAYAWLIEIGVVSESAAQSGLEPEEAAAFVEVMMELGADDTLHSDNMWARVASEGTTEGVERETVAEHFGLDETAAKVGLSPKDMVDVVARTQKYNNGESLLGDPEFWKEAGKTGPDGAEAMAIRGGFDLPDGVLPGAGPGDLLDGIADIQENNGDPSSQEDWNDYTGEGSGPGTGSGEDTDGSDTYVGPDWFAPSGDGAETEGVPGGTIPGVNTPGGSTNDPPAATSDGTDGTGSTGDPPAGTSGGTDGTGPTGDSYGVGVVTHNPDGSWTSVVTIYDSEGNALGSIKQTFTQQEDGTWVDESGTETGSKPAEGEYPLVPTSDGGWEVITSDNESSSADTSTADAESDPAPADTAADEDSDPAPADTSSGGSSDESADGDGGTEGTPDPEGASGGGKTWAELSDEEKQAVCDEYNEKQQGVMGGMEGEFSMAGCASGPDGPGDFKTYLKARSNPYILTDESGDSGIIAPVTGAGWTKGDLVDTLPDPIEPGGTIQTEIPGKDLPDGPGTGGH